MLTGQADSRMAVDAMPLGAENFLTRPIESAHLEAAIERAYEKVELRRRNRFLSARDADLSGTAALGRSRNIQEIAPGRAHRGQRHDRAAHR